MAVNGVVGRLEPERIAQRQNPFVRGMTRAFDFAGTSHRTPDSRRVATTDTDAIRDTWCIVGEELEEAMIRFGDSESP